MRIVFLVFLMSGCSSFTTVEWEAKNIPLAIANIGFDQLEKLQSKGSNGKIKRFKKPLLRFGNFRMDTRGKFIVKVPTKTKERMKEILKIDKPDLFPSIKLKVNRKEAMISLEWKF